MTNGQHKEGLQAVVTRLDSVPVPDPVGSPTPSCRVNPIYHHLCPPFSYSFSQLHRIVTPIQARGTYRPLIEGIPRLTSIADSTNPGSPNPPSWRTRPTRTPRYCPFARQQTSALSLATTLPSPRSSRHLSTRPSTTTMIRVTGRSRKWKARLSLSIGMSPRHLVTLSPFQLASLSSILSCRYDVIALNGYSQGQVSGIRDIHAQQADGEERDDPAGSRGDQSDGRWGEYAAGRKKRGQWVASRTDEAEPLLR